MTSATLTFAFTAGLVATINPCGFAMLPAYLSYFLGTEEAEALKRREEAKRLQKSLLGNASSNDPNVENGGAEEPAQQTNNCERKQAFSENELRDYFDLVF